MRDAEEGQSSSESQKVSDGFSISVNKHRKRASLLSADLKEIRDQARLALKESQQVPLFRGMFRDSQRLYERFLAEHERLEDLETESGINYITATDRALRANTKKYQYEINSAYETFVSRDSKASMSMFPQSTRRTRLPPPISKLPTFDGTLAKWPEFKDQFESMINNDPDISDLDKFHYLLPCLSGLASTVVGEFPITEANFSLAWNALLQTFDNKRILAVTYLNTLIESPKLSSTADAAERRIHLTHLQKSEAAFSKLAIPDEAAFIKFYLVYKSLDQKTRQDFEATQAKSTGVFTKFPTFKELIDFLLKRCEETEFAALTSTSLYETSTSKPVKVVTPSTSTSQSTRPPNPRFHPKQALLVTPTATSNFLPPSCHVCHQPHHLYVCPKFIAASPTQRHELLTGFKGCTNCLSSMHTANQFKCTNQFKCRKCNQRHHSLLHLDNDEANKPNSTNDQPPGPSTASPSFAGHITAQVEPNVLLGTLGVRVWNESLEQWDTARFVLDSGAQHSLMTEAGARRLGLRLAKTNREIVGVGQAPVTVQGIVQGNLRPRQVWEPQVSAAMVVVPSIVDKLPHQRLPRELRHRLSAHSLSDPSFGDPAPVDGLIGMDLFPQLITGPPVIVGEHDPYLLPTVFGNVVMGSFKPQPAETCLFLTLTSLRAPPKPKRDELLTKLEKFWVTEEVAQARTPPDKETCEVHFQQAVYREKSGRYVVSLPFQTSQVELGDSSSQALRRFLNLESKLLKQPSLRQQYHEFIREYLKNEWMAPTANLSRYVVPHHAVLKPSSTTTKLRVVFDFSCRTSRGVSLNDTLMPGPKLQNDISDILLNFRLFPYVFTCDIVKMFPNIQLNPADRPYQHIFWRFDPSEPVVKYELSNLSFGLTCAPFLALRVLQQLASDEGHGDLADAARILTTDVYVDDIVTGTNSIETAITLQAHLIELLGKGCFKLSKWASNTPALLNSLEDTAKGPIAIPAEPGRSVGVLGLKWEPQEDLFAYNCKSQKPIYTRRGILSVIAGLYDPVGFLAPIIFKAKCLMQLIFKSSREGKQPIAWDEEVSPHIRREWSSFLNDLPSIAFIRIPRYLGTAPSSPCQLVGFCDGSELGFGAAIYLKVNSDPPEVYLLRSKTRVAPLKLLTIPRLELCGAVLLAEVMHATYRLLQEKLPLTEMFLFTDSATVLNWLGLPSDRLKTFVAHRVTRILELTDVKNWQHVPSKQNPADLASRGVMPSQLSSQTIWWSGPEWLKLSPSYWPSPLHLPSPHEDASKEVKTSSSVNLLATLQQYTDWSDWMQRFSMYSRLVRSTAYLLRFCHNAKPSSRDSRRTGPISCQEFINAELTCIKFTQAVFHSESSKAAQSIKDLAPFRDERQLLRVGGRLVAAPLPQTHIHPFILPKGSHFSRLLINYLHKIHSHPGTSALLAILRRRFWIPAARSLIKSVKLACVTCRRYAKINNFPLMGSLPKDRFIAVRPFMNVGVDYAGPFSCVESRRRKSTTVKAYLCLFICLATKAIHVELAHSLSTEEFLNVLDRFVARRGLPANIFSDCGTNFVGAASYLRELKDWLTRQDTQQQIVNHLAQRHVSWKFIPPASPHFGGLWEAGVKSVKMTLHKMIGAHILTTHELETIFIKIEGILNSRPLGPVSTDPDDLETLTPGHFLIGQALTTLPDRDYTDIPQNRLSRWQLLRERIQYFWSRWSQDYLHTLQQRAKWQRSSVPLQVGDLVLVKDSSPPTHWPLARVTGVFPGDDAQVRVVSIKTASGTYKRPAVKCIPLLPTTTEQSN